MNLKTNIKAYIEDHDIAWNVNLLARVLGGLLLVEVLLAAATIRFDQPYLPGVCKALSLAIPLSLAAYGIWMVASATLKPLVLLARFVRMPGIDERFGHLDQEDAR